MPLNKELLELLGFLSLLKENDFFTLQCNDIKYKFTFDKDSILMHNPLYNNMTIRSNVMSFFQKHNYNTRINIYKKIIKNRQRTNAINS